REGNYHELERLRGVREALATGEPGAATLQVMGGDFNFSGGIKAAVVHLALPPERRATAVVCANDDTAIGFIKTVVDGGLGVPDDVSVLGFDGAPVGAFMVPSLSTIQQSTTELGQLGADLIIRLVQGEALANSTRVEVACQLVLRQSVKGMSR
ncbi:MAG: substrate-binding domain-containing protein, partial [Devosia sp.]